MDLGYHADDTVLAEVDGRLGGLDEASSLALYARLEERLAALPGVQSASVVARIVPVRTISVSTGSPTREVGPPAQPATTRNPRAGVLPPWNGIGASYFDAMGIRVAAAGGSPPRNGSGKGAPSGRDHRRNAGPAVVARWRGARQPLQWAPDDGQPASRAD